jgi:predicted metal-dependent hydrolase
MFLKINESILISIIIIFIYIFYTLNKNKLTLVTLKTGENFRVVNDNNKIIAANLLLEIKTRMYKLRDHLEQNISKYKDYREYIQLLVDNMSNKRTSIYENDPNSDLTSFSVNKGEEIAFCLKSKKNKQFHDINLLMYVAIHEMSHIACPEVGHGELFKKIFHFLVLCGIEIGIYNKEDYGLNPVEYCGMMLSSSIV